MSLKNDNLRSFLMDWEHVLTGMNPVPDEAVLETLFRLQVTKSAAMRDTMNYYNRLSVGHAERTYDFLISSVRRHLELQRRTQTRHELQSHLSGGQAAGGAMVGSKGGGKKGKGGRSQTPKGERVPTGHCRDWVKKGICARGDSCPYIHDNSMKGKPSRSTSAGKTKGGGKGKKTRSSSPAADKPPCRQFLKGKCTRGTSAHIGMHLRVVSSKTAIAMPVKSVYSFTPTRPQSARGDPGQNKKKDKRIPRTRRPMVLQTYPRDGKGPSLVADRPGEPRLKLPRL